MKLNSDLATLQAARKRFVFLECQVAGRTSQRNYLTCILSQKAEDVARMGHVGVSAGIILQWILNKYRAWKWT
jgi:hypothetical protein